MEHPNTAQEVFETVARHLFAQGYRAVADDSCRLHIPNDGKCAVGCLIFPEEYSPRMEDDSSVSALLENYEESDNMVWPQLQWMRPYSGLLRDLQQAHDNSDNWDSWCMRHELYAIAQTHGLDGEFLNELQFNR